MVDGALGMGFGPTSSSILLSSGLSPAAVSTTVNLAKVATGLAGGIAHWRFKNVDHRLVLELAIPGCIGAGIGVTILNNVDGDQLKPFLAALLLLVGIRILFRFSRPLPPAPANPTMANRAHRAALRRARHHARGRHRRHHQRPRRRLGSGGHTVPPAPRAHTEVRRGFGEHRRGRGRDRLVRVR